MTREELLRALSEPFYTDFADTTAMTIRRADAVALLYAVATDAHADLPKAVRHKVLFRGAYVLERIYFADPARFAPYADCFCRHDFPACEDASARRHFTKIMTHLLGRSRQDSAPIEPAECRHNPDAAPTDLPSYHPDSATLDAIAQAAARWAVDPAARVAVRIGAVEVLRACRDRIEWIADIWDDILQMLRNEATPGIEARRKKWQD